MKRNKIKSARNKADRLWSKLILTLHPKCEYCGQPSADPHHFIPKSLSSALRYSIANGVGLCRKHHFIWHNQEDADIHATIVLQRGAEWIEKIRGLRNVQVKTNLAFYTEHIKMLEQALNEME